jgi:hypothetical protein
MIAPPAEPVKGKPRKRGDWSSCSGSKSKGRQNTEQKARFVRWSEIQKKCCTSLEIDALPEPPGKRPILCQNRPHQIAQ